MKRDVQKTINEALVKVYAGGKIEEAVSEILGDPGIAPGVEVAILSDPVWGMEGIKGRVKGPSGTKGSGFVDVELANGVIMPMESNLLAPL
jgi:hypothetical protein